MNKISKQLISIASYISEQQAQQWCANNVPNRINEISDPEFKKKVLNFLVNDLLHNHGGNYGGYYITQLLQDEHLTNEQIYYIKDALEHLDGKFLADLITKYRN